MSPRSHRTAPAPPLPSSDPLEAILRRKEELEKTRRSLADKFRAALHEAVDAEVDMTKCAGELAELKIQEEQLRDGMEDEGVEGEGQMQMHMSSSAKRRERRKRNGNGRWNLGE